LILTGGGARELSGRRARAIRELLPAPRRNPFPILCGTSAGAVNAASMAVWPRISAPGAWRTRMPGRLPRFVPRWRKSPTRTVQLFFRQHGGRSGADEPHHDTLSLILQDVRRQQGRSLRPVEVLTIAPSQRLDHLAARHAKALPWPVRVMLHGIGATNRNAAQLTAICCSNALHQGLDRVRPCRYLGAPR